jgi:hypothetical protein
MADQDVVDQETEELSESPSARHARVQARREQIRNSAAIPVQAQIDRQLRESGLSR